MNRTTTGGALPSAGNLLAIDRALRRARQRALPDAQLADLLWEVLSDLHGAGGAAHHVSLAQFTFHDAGGSVVERSLELLAADGFLELQGDPSTGSLQTARLTSAGVVLIETILADAAMLLMREKLAA